MPCNVCASNDFWDAWMEPGWCGPASTSTTLRELNEVLLQDKAHLQAIQAFPQTPWFHFGDLDPNGVRIAHKLQGLSRASSHTSSALSLLARVNHQDLQSGGLPGGAQQGVGVLARGQAARPRGVGSQGQV
jgi:hypothetical protein